MPSLLDLPREVRDEIIREVVLIQHEPPPNALRQRRKDVEEYPPIADFRDSIFQPDHLSMQPLLQVSKQLRAETQDAIAYHRSAPALVLDLAFIDWNWLWPTWRNILPRTTKVLDKIDVNIILSATKDDHESKDYTQTRTWETWKTCSIFWGFISRLLTVGPIRPGEAGMPDLNICVRELRINLDTTLADVFPPHPIPEKNIPARKMDGLAHLSHDQLFAVDSHHGHTWFNKLYAYLDDQLRETVRCTPAYQQLLERVGKIIFTTNGGSPSIHYLLLESFEENWPEREDPKIKAYNQRLKEMRRRNGLA